MYVRISIVRPMPQEFIKVSRVLDELTDFLASQEGYAGGLRLESDSGQTRPWPAGFPTGLLGRVSLWTDEAAADRSSQVPPVVALRAQLNALTVDHQEYAFFGSEITARSG